MRVKHLLKFYCGPVPGSGHQGHAKLTLFHECLPFLLLVSTKCSKDEGNMEYQPHSQMFHVVKDFHASSFLSHPDSPDQSISSQWYRVILRELTLKAYPAYAKSSMLFYTTDYPVK